MVEFFFLPFENSPPYENFLFRFKDLGPFLGSKSVSASFLISDDTILHSPLRIIYTLLTIVPSSTMHVPFRNETGLNKSQIFMRNLFVSVLYFRYHSKEIRYIY